MSVSILYNALMLLVCLVFAVPGGAALIPALPGVAETAKAGPSSLQGSNANEPERLRQLLNAARVEFEAVDRPGGLAVAAPAGTPEHELVRRRFMLRVIARNYDRHLTELENIETLHEKRKELERRLAEGIRFKESPPYSVLMLEGLREQVQVEFYRVKDAEISLEVNSAKIRNAGENLKKAEERLRKLVEQIEREVDPAVKVSLEWKKTLAELGRKVFAAEFAALRVAEKRIEEELTVARQEFAFQEKRLETAGKNSVFTEDDLKSIKARLNDRKRRFEADLEKALTDNQSLRKRLAGKSAAQDGGKLSLQETLDREELENSNLQIEVCQNFLDINRLELVIWELRFAAEAKREMDSTRRIVLLLPRFITELERQEQLSDAGLKLILRQLNEKESQLAQSESASGGEQAVVRRFIELYQAREKMILAKIREIEAAKSVFVRLRDQYSDATKTAAANARLKYWKTVLLEKVGDFWKYELFTTEDTMVVDGREIKGKRGITVGKLLGALLILIIGYIATSRLTRKLVRYFVERYAVQPSSALLARRWVMALILISLLLFSLNIVRIPLTAFAFLGGAIAIGVGFGMQVLMKNLISGVMLLAERPFRIGDLVEVDGIRGRVTNIGIRSSTIRDVAGIETLIPNSTFVEKNVTNWTYSSHQVRYSITVGVSYGSDIPVVKAQLLNAACQHSQLLKEPAPLATLDDFAADALLFGLYYWLDLESGQDPRVVASDLRTMIEKQLSASGILIAFPQRDVHLDSVKPLRIEVVSEKK